MARIIALIALVIVTCVVLSACSRPLTSNERRFADDVIGPALNKDAVRISQGVGFAPPPKTPAEPPNAHVVGSEIHPGFCDRTAPQTSKGPPPAWALYNNISFTAPIYQPDTAMGWPATAQFPQALIMAHELVHVWQWQNRRKTGYRPLRAALEAVMNMDPYFYVPDESAGFLSYGFEQQAALLEDYLCYALYDPENPRRATLRPILAPHFPLDRLDAALVP
ncbi:hypothetical protein OO012_18530 [Rhodobacteraceae bacterium KMM 6894]|nr:hypothetical protein [Rhodobacteraceae bacterium KMM 6894]